MNTAEILEKWEQNKAKLKQRFPVLKDRDLMFKEGREDEMFLQIEIKVGKTRDELKKIISSF